MVQAARSGKQNLAEGNIDGITSKEMEMKLTNVNRASLHELLLDYEDYLRVRGLQHWGSQDPRYQQTAQFCRNHLDSAIYRDKIQSRSDEVIANPQHPQTNEKDFTFPPGCLSRNDRYGKQQRCPLGLGHMLRRGRYRLLPERWQYVQRQHRHLDGSWQRTD
jgi:hypothetical protein